MLTPDTIEVGKFYENTKFPGTIYLGILFVTPRLPEFNFPLQLKTLAIIKEPNGKASNRTVYWEAPVTERNKAEFWNGFKEYIHQG